MHIEAALEMVDEFLACHPVSSTPDVELRGARFDAGLAFPQFDPGCGGSGWDASITPEVERRFLEAGAVDWSDANVIGLGMAAPTIHAHGTPDQRALLRPLFTGEHVWCQLFSEPDAGSDLASLATRAVPDGDEWVVNGQKVWTTLGHVARYGLLLARTDPDVPKHRGLTYFVLDMKSPGVDVRPLRQLTGEAEFNEVHLDEVRVSASAVVGAAGAGWSIAMTTLMNERVSLPDVAATAGAGVIRRAVRAYQAAQEQGRATPADRSDLLRLWTAAEANRLTGLRAQHGAPRGAPGPEGSVGKLAMAELNKKILELTVRLLGCEGMLMDNYDEVRPALASVHGGADDRKAFLRTRANSIEGGTSEVLRNVLAERVLGLPPEPNHVRDVPWKELRRS